MPSATNITHEEHHRALVSRLAAGITPARRLWPASVRLALWLALEAAILAWVVVHARSDFRLELARPWYFFEIVFFVTAGLLSAQFALRSAIPGRAVRPVEAFPCFGLMLGGTALVLIGQPPDFNYRLADFVRIGLTCAYRTCILGVLPWLVLWWTVKRGAALQGGLSGLFIGAGALLFSFAMMRIDCPIDDPLHLITWHFLPALAGIALSALAGSIWLGFGQRLFRGR
jgi:hypothetical protein